MLGSFLSLYCVNRNFLPWKQAATLLLWPKGSLEVPYQQRSDRMLFSFLFLSSLQAPLKNTSPSTSRGHVTHFNFSASFFTLFALPLKVFWLLLHCLQPTQCTTLILNNTQQKYQLHCFKKNVKPWKPVGNYKRKFHCSDPPYCVTVFWRENSK